MTTQPTLVPCPRCHATIKPVPIVYGYPTVETMREAEAGRLSLGGCMVDDDSSDYACPRCDSPLPSMDEHPQRAGRS